MSEKKSIFREKSIQRISSPEEINDYIHVTTPSVWVILIAVIVLLVGAIVWGTFGTVTMHDEDGNEYQQHPITFILN